jgi:hypothetical protein
VAVRTDSPSMRRSVRSDLDRRAIRVVGSLLATGVWLELQLRNTLTPRTGLVGRSGWVRSPQRRTRSVDLQVPQPTRKQPSRTADFALVSR